ncbi:MAG TPA: 1,4-dihydroxy-2-naphthoyl-CoA hydrolase [Cyanobacteria bacterium UBA8156]|nr:1,4-dihydroxy-2-naphthoyl-CoA hydrolase [Cyanobacteria bacterium UBA8156]
MPITPSFLYTVPYTVALRDTDAAGVLFFARALAIAHCAYEAALQEAGFDLRRFFREWAIPIVEVQGRFWQPLYAGDRLRVEVTVLAVAADSFRLGYAFWQEGCDRPSFTGETRHVCIDPDRRTRQPLPAAMVAWLGNATH